jgi:peptidoglycan/LPS O-acetylase OafA/YrhL
MLDAESREHAARRLPAWVALAAWIAFTLAFKLGVFGNAGPAYYVASAAACGLVVLKACDASSSLARVLASPAPRALGRISYSFFLVHFIVVHGFGRVLDGALGPQDRVAFAAGVLIGGFVLSLASAWILYIVAERFYFRSK